MPPISRLGRQIAEVTSALAAIDTPCALIGGLALASHKVVRATQDVDLLVDAEKTDAIEALLLSLGYRCLHRSEDAGNYVRGDERLDLLYARRPIARLLLSEAKALDTAFGSLRVIGAEGLVGFKLQALVNDPSFSTANPCLMSSSMPTVDAPFAASAGVQSPVPIDGDPYAALDELMVVVEALCPEWPARPLFKDGGRMLL